MSYNKIEHKYQCDQWDTWMQDALTGDQSSYRKLLYHLKPWLTAYFAKRLNNDEAEDLAQDTLLTVHNKRQTFDTHQKFGPWVSTIARHRLIDHLRKLKRTAETTEFNEEYQGQSDGFANAADNAIDLEKYLSILTKEQAEIVNLIKVHEYTAQEVSEKTGHSVSSVKVIVHRAIKKMGEHFNTGKFFIF